MSQALTVFGATYALQVGTKKKPASIHADRAGVALTTGKAGKLARDAEKSDMPRQAMNGNYAKFSGYLVALFPKVAAEHAGRVKTHAETLRLMASQGIELTEQQVRYLAAADSADFRTRVGFEMLVQSILNNAPVKQTKQQVEALAIVRDYVELSAAKQAELQARQAEEEAAEAATA